MAYKFSTGSVSVGDLSSKDDPGTEIDFEDNTIKLTAGGTTSLTVTDTVTTISSKFTASNGMAFAGEIGGTGHISGSGHLQIGGNAYIGGTAEVLGAAHYRANVTLGDASGDVTTVKGKFTASNGLKVEGESLDVLGHVNIDGILSVDSNSNLEGDVTASNGILIPDDTLLRFGTGPGDATIEYDENGTDTLKFAGATIFFGQNIFHSGSTHSIQETPDDLANSTAAIPASSILKGLVTITIDGGAKTKNLPSAASIVSAIPGATAGFAFDFVIINKAEDMDQDLSVGVAGGSGITLVGDGLLRSEVSGMFRALVTNTSTPAVTIYRLS